MHPRFFAHNLALVTVLALLLHPWMARSGDEPAGSSDAALPEQAVLQATPDPPEANKEMREQKAHYHRDPTGVRARLGMCRRDDAEHPGRQRRFHGGGHRWTIPPP